MVELCILGSLELRKDGRPVHSVLAQPKRVGLLTYLALARPVGPVRRDTLLALFWPEHDEKGARHALSQALHFLRRTLGAEVITSRGGDEIGVDTNALRCDVLDFEQALATGDPESALALYRGDLLAGFHLNDAPEFDRWLESQRAGLRSRATGAAHRRAEQAVGEGKRREAAAWAARAVSLDPLNERAVRRLMRAGDAAGDRAGALRAYQGFAKHVASELEAEPAPETRALAEEIRRREEAQALTSSDIPSERIAAAVAEFNAAQSPPPAIAESAGRAAMASRDGARRRRNVRWIAALAMGSVAIAGASLAMNESRAATAESSIVVLPFDDMGAARTDDYLVDGLTEDLTTILSKLEGLEVASRTSAFAYKGKRVDVREIGKQLGVALALEGSARRDGEKLRVTAQLVNTRTGYHVWSETYDRSMADVFALQEEIARAVASMLHLRNARTMNIAYRAPNSVAAYEAYLRARHLLREQGHERTLSAIRFFGDAIALDSTYARAHAGLADAYIALAEFMVPRPFLPRAKAAALRALELDSTIAETRMALGDLRLIYDRDWTAAEREYLRAIQLEPHSAGAHQRYARFLAAAGRFDEHLQFTKKALEIAREHAIDPQAFAVREQVALASAYFAARQYDRALHHCRRALELDPGSWNAHAVLGRTYVELGRYDDAIATLNKAWPASLRLPALARLGYAYGRAGQTQPAQRILGELRARNDSAYLPKDQIALVQLGLGDREGALASLELAYEERHWWLPWINQSPPFDVLRSDPRFAGLLKKLGVP